MSTLAVRLDNAGDVLLLGPALRALRAAPAPARLDLLVSPAGQAAAQLLPGIDDVLTFDPPWSGFQPPRLDAAEIAQLVRTLAERRYDRMVIFTSFHQSPLPMAMLGRLAGIPFIAANSEDYPGSLLDLRHHRAEVHEVTAALELALAAGGKLAEGDRGDLRVVELPATERFSLPDRPYVVVHPGASVPARSLLPGHARQIVTVLRQDGWDVVVTGSRDQHDLAAEAAGSGALNLAGHTSLAELAQVLRAAACTVAGNTGPAHLSAATGTPVVCLFSPVVPAGRWAPYGPHILLGDQQAACRDTRARECPVPGHPCLSGVPPAAVVAAVHALTRREIPGQEVPGREVPARDISGWVA